jgi:hypothetical protein
MNQKRTAYQLGKTMASSSDCDAREVEQALLYFGNV